MQLDKFVFSPFVQGMFDESKASAIFIFQHVGTNLHYAARYWDASRYRGSENYPLVLTNQLIKNPSEVNVYVLPLKTKVRTTAEKIMNKVVDALIDQGLYRKCRRLVNNAFNVIHQELFKIYKLVHNGTGAEYYTHELDTVPGEAIITRSLIRFNELAIKPDVRDDAVVLFARQYYPNSRSGWSLHELVTVHSLSQAYQTIEELCNKALRQGKLILNRIRTHSPVWYYNNIHRGKNLLIEEYLHMGVTGQLKAVDAV